MLIGFVGKVDERWKKEEEGGAARGRKWWEK